MPRISSFYGIIIWMYWNDHNPPHFHAIYNNFEVLISISDLKIYAGSMPSRALLLITEWAFLHQDKLSQNWNLLKENLQPEKIEPLT